MTTSKVLVVAATPLESQLLQSTDLLVAGIGAVNTAHALGQRFATKPAPSLVIQTGIAGAFVQANVAVGSVLLADTEIYGDLGVLTPAGWRPLEEIGIPLIAATPAREARFNYFPLDTALVQRACTIAGAMIARTGKFLTVSEVTGVRSKAD
jgi:futalosine hydrolase